MAKIKIKIQDLIDRFMATEFEGTECSMVVPFPIKIRNHEGIFVNVHEFVKKRVDSYKITFGNGKTLICALSHILLTKEGQYKVEDITNQNVVCGNGTTKIVSKQLNKGNDVLYDVCIDEPHLFMDSDGFVHHNSLMISYLLKSLWEHKQSENGVIIVPSIGLVTQFHSDMIEYGIDSSLIGRVGDGRKEWGRPFTVSTWQSLSKEKHRMRDFQSVVVDETHGASASKVSDLLQASNAKYRYGFTGTLPADPLDQLKVRSYLGPVVKDYGSVALAQLGYVSECKINMINIEYGNKPKGSYDTIKDVTFKNKFRLNTIVDITKNCEGSVLILVTKVAEEGEFLEEFLRTHSEMQGKEIVFLSGKDSAEKREFWRKETDKKDNVVLIATYGIYQQGVNIKSLSNLILASPSKSKIRVLQSIGRALRLHYNKDGAIIWDLADTVKHLKNHSDVRRKYYSMESFRVEEMFVSESYGFNLQKEWFKI